MTSTQQPQQPYTDLVVSCKAFSSFPLAAQRVRVYGPDDVLVYDDIAGHYTRCHALSPRTQRRMARIADAVDQ